MNESKAINALTNIFHIETYTGENGNYELSSNSWGLKFNVRIREYTIFIQDGKGARCSIDADEDLDTMCQEIVAFIGEVIKDESKNYTFETRSHILAWPYNCNTSYVNYLKTAFDMNPEEGEFDYAERKSGLTNARKPIKSAYKGLDEEVGDLQIDMTNTGYFEDGWLLLEGENEEGYRDGTEFTINAYGPNGEDLGSKKFDFLDLWHNGKPVNSSIQSSMQGQERSIQAIMDEYGCTREEAIDIMNSEVTSGCHGEAKKKNKKEIKFSDTEIESSTERNANNLNKIFG